MKLQILRDEDPGSPREFDNLGLMACWHGRYSLGDVQPKERPAEWLKKNAPHGSVVLPLFLFDHSGITMSTSPDQFRAADSAGWDWGQVGNIIATPNAMRDNFMVERLSKDMKDKSRKILVDEVKTYDHFLQGQVWGFIYTPDKGEEDSCWGFYGDTLEETGILDHLPPEAQELTKKAWEDRYGQQGD